MQFFKFLRKKKMVNEIKEYLDKGAVVLDVRSVEEWNEGHCVGATLVTLGTIPVRVDEIKEWSKPIIAVCRSGARSEQATQFLRSHGLDVINGGPWQNVAQYTN
ncbi:rhodanese-like domain-containing protein [Tenacibaculum sp. IB213877]|jgi:phage shock protein E|uniref:rhodanese-like domain-containing protein n=1 Tax=Tenacibaculum sp. IB213877 TaxID=3097351 RepID=UPI002A5AEC7F|nr:rhodanese-like domain-containing protein [Tenacibaculum sp. IB213877]MDY0780908.1 rhodanese-like domain-containing protein [Tenacibaculum sp. IB213877]